MEFHSIHMGRKMFNSASLFLKQPFQSFLSVKLKEIVKIRLDSASILAYWLIFCTLVSFVEIDRLNSLLGST